MAAKRAHSPEPETRAPSPVASAIAAILASFPATITPRLPPIGLLHQLYARGLLSRTAIDREYDSMVRAGDIISLHYDAAPPERIFLRIAGNDDDDRQQQQTTCLFTIIITSHADYTEYLKAWGDMHSSKDAKALCGVFSEKIASKHHVALCVVVK